MVAFDEQIQKQEKSEQNNPEAQVETRLIRRLPQWGLVFTINSGKPSHSEKWGT